MYNYHLSLKFCMVSGVESEGEVSVITNEGTKTATIKISLAYGFANASKKFNNI